VGTPLASHPPMPSPFSWVSLVRLSAQQVRHPELIRSPNRILAHLWDGVA